MRVRGGWRMGPACHENEGRKNNYSLHIARRILAACSEMMSGGQEEKKDRVISLSSFLASVFLRKHRNLNNDIFWYFLLRIR